jgi:hypothetical protein
MIQYLDPTYLRYIHDGLQSGAVHKDNATSLPDGLVGMYEESLLPETNVNDRKRFLEFFGVWALLKKEVSAEFVSMILEWEEKEVNDSMPYPGKDLFDLFYYSAEKPANLEENEIGTDYSNKADAANKPSSISLESLNKYKVQSI